MQRRLNTIEIEFCICYKEKWFKIQLTNNIYRAYKYLRDKKIAYSDPFLIGWHNQIDPSIVPIELIYLTTLEEIIITRVHLYL